VGVRDIRDSRDGDLAAYAVGPANSTMSPERRERHPRAAEQRSESSGGLLLPAVGFIIGTVVGWLAYVFAALVVLNYLVRLDAIVTIAGLSSSTTFWVAVGVLVVIAFVLFGWPGTVLGGWLLMAGVVAAVATYGVGWTQTIVIVEGLTLAFVGVAAFVKMVSMLPTWAVFYLDFNRRRRR
jgi:hypothetical protein